MVRLFSIAIFLTLAYGIDAHAFGHRGGECGECEVAATHGSAGGGGSYGGERRIGRRGHGEGSAGGGGRLFGRRHGSAGGGGSAGGQYTAPVCECQRPACEPCNERGEIIERSETGIPPAAIIHEKGEGKIEANREPRETKRETDDKIKQNRDARRDGP